MGDDYGINGGGPRGLGGALCAGTFVALWLALLILYLVVLPVRYRLRKRRERIAQERRGFDVVPSRERGA